MVAHPGYMAHKSREARQRRRIALEAEEGDANLLVYTQYNHVHSTLLPIYPRHIVPLGHILTTFKLPGH